MRDLDAAALRLRDACLILLDETRPDSVLRAEVFAHISREQLAAATERVGQLARPPDDAGYYEELLGRYSQMTCCASPVHSNWALSALPSFMRTIQSGSRTSTLVRAIAELGRIAKTLFLLAYIDDEGYRRRILVQLNRSEGRHRLARAVFHGQRGELRHRYREGQQDQLGALGLLVNAIILWNTRYIERALTQLAQIGLDIRPEGVERIWPLGFQHVNLLGRYSFDLPEQLIRGELRSLRDPSDAADEEVLVAWTGFSFHCYSTPNSQSRGSNVTHFGRKWPGLHCANRDPSRDKDAVAHFAERKPAGHTFSQTADGARRISRPKRLAAHSRRIRSRPVEGSAAVYFAQKKAGDNPYAPASFASPHGMCMDCGGALLPSRGSARHNLGHGQKR